MPARLDERATTSSLPGALVEVDRQEPTGLVRKKRIDAHDVPALKMVENDLIVHWDEGLVRALAALAASGSSQTPGTNLLEQAGA